MPLLLHPLVPVQSTVTCGNRLVEAQIPFKLRASFTTRSAVFSQQPQFAQIYFHDSDQDAEVGRRLDFICEPRNQAPRNGWDGAREQDKDKNIIRILQRLMYRYNLYARRFKTIGERVRADDAPVLGLKIVCQRAGDARRYNRPTADE
ncbi:hypothetical protein BGX30_008900, partial [Mortierella sp. GBA39]